MSDVAALGVAIAVHLMVDFKTLYLIDSLPEQREDFVVFGDILLQVFDQLIIDIERDYKTDVSDLLNGFSSAIGLIVSPARAP